MREWESENIITMSSERGKILLSLICMTICFIQFRPLPLSPVIFFLNCWEITLQQDFNSLFHPTTITTAYHQQQQRVWRSSYMNFVFTNWRFYVCGSSDLCLFIIPWENSWLNFFVCLWMEIYKKKLCKIRKKTHCRRS